MLCPYAPAILSGHLYQGPHYCLEWADEYDLVVSAAEEVEPPPGGIHLDLDDVETDWRAWPEFQRAVREVAEEVAAEVANGGRVLVVCYSGWNRSGLVVGLALRLLGMPADQVVEYVRRKRHHNALSNESFADAVENMQLHRGEARRNPSYKPPAAVRKAAELGLRLRKVNQKRGLSRPGGTEVGVARAVQLSTGRNVSLKTMKRMRSYFARHAVDKKAAGWGNLRKPTPGRVAWELWGGDAGRAWVEKELRRRG